MCIDPDHFKALMPEWEGYCSVGDQAGDMCHRESGFLQEIAQEAAMLNSQNVWVDGSLRDGPWLAEVLAAMRRRPPARPKDPAVRTAQPPRPPRA